MINIATCLSKNDVLNGNHPVAIPVQDQTFNSLPNNKVVDGSKLEAFADDILKVTENIKFLLK